jgi:hypothetical protein
MTHPDKVHAFAARCEPGGGYFQSRSHKSLIRFPNYRNFRARRKKLLEDEQRRELGGLSTEHSVIPDRKAIKRMKRSPGSTGWKPTKKGTLFSHEFSIYAQWNISDLL